MKPAISKPDRVLASPQAKVENDQIAAVVNDHGKTQKRLHYEEDHIYLTSDNPKYQPMFWSRRGKSKILGKVVRVVKRVKP